jgi:circadian clock protein KaiC
MRGGNHAKDIREYEITNKGVLLLDTRLTEYQGLIGGLPVHTGRSGRRVGTLVDAEDEENS